MWRGWQLMGEALKRELLTINQLQAKEHDSGCGSWATNTPDAPVKLSDLPFAVSSNVAHCDLMAWQLRASAKYFLQDGKWNEAMSMLQPLAGLRPNCYWTLLQKCDRNSGHSFYIRVCPDFGLIFIYLSTPTMRS
jgi:hypothetical protein